MAQSSRPTELEISTGATAIVFHSEVISGPARSFASRLPMTTSRSERIIYVPAHGPVEKLFSDLGEVRVLDYDSLTVPSSPLGIARSLARLLRQTFTFIREFRSGGAETVICATTYTPAALVAARCLRLRTVVYCGEIFQQANDQRIVKKAFARVLVAIVSRSSDVIICCSDLVKEQFPARSNAVTVYPSIPVAELMLARSESPQSERGRTLAVIGSVSQARGQDLAIRAMPAILEALPDAQLFIAGAAAGGEADVAFADSLRELVDELNLGSSVEFLGHVSAVEELLAKTLVVVNPARFDEPFGRVAYEALAAGCGVVLSRTGAAEELLRDELNVLMVPRGDTDRLASAAVRLLKDPARCAQMANASDTALELVEASTTDRQYLDALKDAFAPI